MRHSYARQVLDAAEEQREVPAHRHEPLDLVRRLEQRLADELRRGVLAITGDASIHLHRVEDTAEVVVALLRAVALHDGAEVRDVDGELQQRAEQHRQVELRALLQPVAVVHVPLQQRSGCGSGKDRRRTRLVAVVLNGLVGDEEQHVVVHAGEERVGLAEDPLRVMPRAQNVRRRGRRGR